MFTKAIVRFLFFKFCQSMHHVFLNCSYNQSPAPSRGLKVDFVSRFRILREKCALLRYNLCYIILLKNVSIFDSMRCTVIKIRFVLQRFVFVSGFILIVVVGRIIDMIKKQFYSDRSAIFQ